MAPRWRLVIDAEADGPWNMGVDEALLASAVAAGRATLRFYRWRGPWLSLGYGQRVPAPQLAACAAAGVGVVRRVTGGSAVLHGADLTYAVAAPEGLLPSGLHASYQRLGAALRGGLLALGVAAEHAPTPEGAGAAGFDCFARTAGHELCVGGRKLVGSAQRRAGGGVLQHGSIRLAPDSARARAAAGLATGVATSLQEVGCGCSLEQLIEACTAAFGDVLEVELTPGALGPEELARARRRGCEPPATAVTDARTPHGAPQECISLADR